MLEINSKKKLIIGMFVLLAVSLAGYNMNRFLSLYDRPLIGASIESRLASEKWHRLAEFMENNKTAAKIMMMNFINNAPSQNSIPAQTIPDTQTAPAQKDYNSDMLPVISGIMRTLKSDGRSQVAVIINNKPFSENESVEGFVIKEITEKGIYLTKGKRNWFVKSPDISYSLDRGN